MGKLGRKRNRIQMHPEGGMSPASAEILNRLKGMGMDDVAQQYLEADENIRYRTNVIGPPSSQMEGVISGGSNMASPGPSTAGKAIVGMDLAPHIGPRTLDELNGKDFGAGMGNVSTTSDMPDIVEGAGEPGEQASMGDFMKSMTPEAYTKLALASTGLQTLGAFADISSDEKATLEGMSQKYQIDLDQIQFQSWMRDSLRASTELSTLINSSKQIEEQGQGPVQQQQFIRSPTKGTLI